MLPQFEAVNKAAAALSATLKGIDLSAIAAAAGVSKAALAMGDSFKYASAEIDGVKAKLAGLKTAGAGMGGGILGAKRRIGAQPWSYGRGLWSL